MIAEQLRAARICCGLTQAQLAEALGCSTGYIAHLETGRTLPSEGKLLALCELLRLDKRRFIRARQAEKACDKAKMYYDTSDIDFRTSPPLSPEQTEYALKIIHAVEREPQVRAAIDLLFKES